MKCADIIYKLFSAICAAVTHSLHIQQQWRDMGLHDTTPKSNSIPTFPIRFLLLPLFFFVWPSNLVKVWTVSCCSIGSRGGRSISVFVQ